MDLLELLYSNCKTQLKKAYNFNKILSPKVIDSVSVNLDNLEFYIEEILSKGKTPIIVGGTGLYINGAAVAETGATVKGVRRTPVHP